jgi:pilin isopeptide linkage protein/LPXTG-motif cell wall-anchored protein
MMKARQVKRWLLGLTVGAVISLQAMTAFASVSETASESESVSESGAAGYDAERKGSITIIPGDQDQDGKAVDKDKAGSFALYKVGVVVDGTSVTEFKLTDPFKDSGVVLTRETLEDKAAVLPKDLEKFALEHQVKETAKAVKADEAVTDLPVGLYLVRQEMADNAYHKVNPFLVIMPKGSETGYKYEIEAYPKTGRFTAVQLDPPVSKVIKDPQGNVISRGETFTFSMTPSAGAPMPEGTAAGAVKTVTAGAGSVEFGEIRFDAVGGPYTYTFSELPGDIKEYTYDSSVYVMTVNVVRTADDTLAVQSVITKNNEVVDKVEFSNVYKAPEVPETKPHGHSGGGGGGSGTTGYHAVTPQGNTPTPTPTTPGEVLGAIRDAVENSPIGQVLGASRNVKTGDASNMLLYGAGIVLAAILLILWSMLNKKKRHGEK